MTKRIKIDGTLVMFIDSGNGEVSDSAIDAMMSELNKIKVENAFKRFDAQSFDINLPKKLKRDLAIVQ